MTTYVVLAFKEMLLSLLALSGDYGRCVIFVGSPHHYETEIKNQIRGAKTKQEKKRKASLTGTRIKSKDPDQIRFRNIVYRDIENSF